MTSDMPVAWALHDGKAGMASQALGLAEATGFDVAEKRLDISFPWNCLPPGLWPVPFAAGGGVLRPPWPDLVVGCGRNTVVPGLAIRRASGGTTVAAQVQNPRYGRDAFDLIVVPAHDRLQGARIFETLAAVHRVTPARLEAERVRLPALADLPQPRLAVLIGGANRNYRINLPRLADTADSLAQALADSGGSLLLTPSRRTGAAALALLRDKLGRFPGAIWQGSGDNPYFAYLAHADALCVTADSVSMISEAAATGKPVHVLGLDGGGGKFARFHQAMRAAGITRPWAGRIESWSYPVPDDTARAGARLREIVLERLAGRQAA